MTQTIGYWCDECRCKYVQHKCRDGLPCGHDKDTAILVYAKAFGRGGERVKMEIGTDVVSMWIGREGGHGRNYLWETLITLDDTRGKSMMLGEWLRQQEACVIRAFEERWNSRKTPPRWRQIETIDDETVAWMLDGIKP